MIPDCSIIILSYNRFQQTTGPCLGSILDDPDLDGQEIIVIDNCSQDKSPQYLKGMANGHPNIRVVMSDVNRGFAGGNNMGATLARGRILVLLNSDTLVPPGSISTLCFLLKKHPEWAMLGPVTNQAGNEQKIPVQSNAPDLAMEEGDLWVRNSDGDCFASNRLDFFCVAIPRKLYLDMGGMDERFGLGYYEDTEFCWRLLEAGRKMMFTEAVFVYHQAGQSFSALGKQGVKQLMRKNRRILKQKHGDKISLVHQRDCNLGVLDQYIRRKRECSHAAHDCHINYRFEGRMRLAQALYPRHPLKKLVYFLKLRQRKRLWSGI